LNIEGHKFNIDLDKEEKSTLKMEKKKTDDSNSILYDESNEKHISEMT
jgi:hypothetical protein